VKLRIFALALGMMVMAVLAGCGEVATPTTIPTPAPTVPATDTTAPASTPTAPTAATAVSTATTEATAMSTATAEMTPAGTATEAAMTTPEGAATAEATPYSTPTEAGLAGTPAPGTPAAAGTPSLSDPRQVVQDFLTSLQTQPDGSASLSYLSDYQQLRIAAGKSIAALLGIQDVYQSFTVGDAQTSGNRAVVRATLNFASGSQVRDFTLNSDSGAWTINSITPVQSSK
jgi:hypothetical protein